MELSSSWLMFKNLRDQYNLVKPDFEQVNQYIFSGRHLDAPQLLVASDVVLTKAAADVMNDTGYEALEVFSAMLYGMLTPPTQVWFEMQFDEEGEEPIGPALKNWMYRSTRAVHKQLQRSNFYSKIQQFFKELGGYCTAALKCSEVDSLDKAITFEFIPTGDYLFRKTYDGQVGDFFRIYWKTPIQIVKKYKDAAPDTLREMVENESSAAHDDVALIEHTYVLDEPTEEGYIVRSMLYYPQNADKKSAEFFMLKEDFHYEMPYYVQRAEENETTEWGSGPGFHAMADVLRLQEVERTEAFGMHKAVDPPLLAANGLEGRLKTLPGSVSYTDMNPAIKTYVESLYKTPLDLESPFRKIQRLEYQIKRRFYNDVFFSMQRDPNLSPLKAREVDQRDEDKYVRLGPLVTGTYSEMLSPLVTRVFNICMRRFLKRQAPVLPNPPAELIVAMQAGNFPTSYSIELTSPLAKQQNIAAIGPIRNLVMTAKEIAEIKPEVIDNMNADAAYREVANLVGTVPEITNSKEEVAEIRRDRYAAQQAAAKRESQAAQMEMQIRHNESQAKIAGEMSKIQSATRGPTEE